MTFSAHCILYKNDLKPSYHRFLETLFLHALTYKVFRTLHAVSVGVLTLWKSELPGGFLDDSVSYRGE